MSLNRTTTELATEVLRSLAVLAAEETIAAADETYIINIYNDKWDELEGDNLAYWVKSEIPKVVFLVLRDLIALEVQGAFGQPITVEDKEARERVLRQRLRRHTSIKATGHNQETEYF